MILKKTDQNAIKIIDLNQVIKINDTLLFISRKEK